MEEERNKRAQSRAALQAQIQQAQESRQEASQALQELLELEPDIFEGVPEVGEEDSKDVLDILNDSSENTSMAGDEIVPFETENGADDAGALQSALRSLDKIEWDANDVEFFYSQIEIKMASAGVRKQFTKFQVLSSVIPKKVIDQVKTLLRKKETDFANNNSYKLLKDEILRIFGPKPEDAVERALNRVMTDTPSQLARELANDLCQSEMDCKCCPAIVTAMWKRHLPSQVKAGIAKYTLKKDNFNQVTQEADDIWKSNSSASSVASIKSNGAVQASSLDQTLPALQYPIPEVSAIGRGRGGRGRGRGRGRGGGRGGQTATSTTTTTRHKGAKHPDLPEGDWPGCSMHFRWGRGAHFCSEPGTCPWKNVFAPKPRNK